jgi:hypothetical protein
MHEFKNLPTQADLWSSLENQTNQEGIRRIYAHTYKKREEYGRREERFFTFD